MSEITWQVARSDENGTLLEFADGDHKVFIYMPEKFTSSKTLGTLDYEDIDYYLAVHCNHIKRMFDNKEEDDFKDEGVFEL